MTKSVKNFHENDSFKFRGSNQMTNERSVWSARKALAKEFTTNYIDLNTSHEKLWLKKHTTYLAKKMFGGPTDPVRLILNGTYIYIHKSTQFSFQRRPFSMHKQRP